jgi:hypothetical protein
LSPGFGPRLELRMDGGGGGNRVGPGRVASLPRTPKSTAAAAATVTARAKAAARARATARATSSGRSSPASPSSPASSRAASSRAASPRGSPSGGGGGSGGDGGGCPPSPPSPPSGVDHRRSAANAEAAALRALRLDEHRARKESEQSQALRLQARARDALREYEAQSAKTAAFEMVSRKSKSAERSAAAASRAEGLRNARLAKRKVRAFRHVQHNWLAGPCAVTTCVIMCSPLWPLIPSSAGGLPGRGRPGLPRQQPGHGSSRRGHASRPEVNQPCENASLLEQTV